jgi:hypothetical protein
MIDKSIINKIAIELGLKPKTVENVYKAFWFYIKSTIEEMPLKEKIKEEEFLKLRTNYNLPGLGKLICPYDKYIKVYNKYSSKNAKDKED